MFCMYTRYKAGINLYFPVVNKSHEKGKINNGSQTYGFIIKKGF